jgi:beta-1,2-mannosidase
LDLKIYTSMLNLLLRSIFCFLVLFPACSPTRNLSDVRSWGLSEVRKLDDYNPILEPERRSEFECPVRKKEVRWEETNVFNPAAVVRDGRVWLLYRAQDREGTSRIGLASSRSGYDFSRNAEPVLFPARDDQREYEWPGGCEDPRIVRTEDGRFIMTYTAYDGKIARLCVATSLDLVHWEKHGLAFGAKKYRNVWSKSGAIVCEREGDRIIARKIDGKYWMYWGDTDIFLATSSNLIDWKPLEDETGQLALALSPRPGFFDSRLVEPGPFALRTEAGILLLYNSANDAAVGDLTLADRSYSVGQALFARTKPGQLIARSGKFLLTPGKSYETTGAVNNVCFLEGMVWFRDRWFLYYGTADSKIAVAEARN